jgi:hypothetical protein
MTPHESLTRALLDLADVGRRTPCQLDPDPFTSDDWHQRAEAAEQCQPCPVLAACDAVGALERWHVWGGAERTPSPTRATRPTTTEGTPREH